jgi:hypothetical protein
VTGCLLAAVFKVSCWLAFEWIKLTDFRRLSVAYQSVPQKLQPSPDPATTPRTANTPRLLDTKNPPIYPSLVASCEHVRKIKSFRTLKSFKQQGRSRWPRSLRPRSTVAHKLWLRIQPGALDPTRAIHREKNRGEWDGSGTWHVWKKIEMCMEFWSGKRKEGDHVKEEAYVRGYRKTIA